MFPEVPISLRLSGHLLLGVARLYSKKVDYLFHDCNEVLSQMRTMFASVNINLPEDADHATFQAVTLPDTFQLDALEIDTQNLDVSPDKHLKELEQITLPDQTPVEGEYVAILVNEERFDSPPHAELPNRSAGAGSMNQEVLPRRGEVNNDYVDAVGGSFVESLHRSSNADQTTLLGGSSVGIPSPTEVARKAERDALQIQVIEELENDILTTPGGSIFDKSVHKKGSVSQAIPLSTFGEEPPPPFVPENAPAIASLHASSEQNSGASTGGQSIGMELPPSPPVQRQNAQRRRRKRSFDESIVLSNAEMKRWLEDTRHTSTLVRKRKNNPSTTLDVWKFQKHMKKDQMFNEPLLCGMCMKLQDVCERTFPIVIDEMDVETDQAGHSGIEADVEATEQARYHVVHDQDQPEPMQFTLEREHAPNVPEMSSRLEVPASAGRLDDITLMPSVTLEEEPVAPETGLPRQVPCLLKSPEGVTETPSEEPTEVPRFSPDEPEEDLLFLNEDYIPSASPSGHKPGSFDSMSSRTRLVAQYYKDQSPMTELSDYRSGQLSLNKILQGKTRKQCAQMFFETLVLKSCDLIDVEQEKAYGDISVSVTQTLSKLPM